MFQAFFIIIKHITHKIKRLCENKNTIYGVVGLLFVYTVASVIPTKPKPNAFRPCVANGSTQTFSSEYGSK
jgi:hypothetical protein